MTVRFVLLALAFVSLALSCESKTSSEAVLSTAPDARVDGGAVNSDAEHHDTALSSDVADGADVLLAFDGKEDHDQSAAADAPEQDSADAHMTNDVGADTDPATDAGPIIPSCVGDKECQDGDYCTSAGCRHGGSPCDNSSECEEDPLGPECSDGVCGGCTWFPPLWDWKYDLELEIPEDGCPEGRYCPPGKSGACVAECVDSTQCTEPGQDVCGPHGRCGCSDEPALNTCEQFCMMAPWGELSQPWGKCVGCSQWVDALGPAKMSPGVVIQLCESDGACADGKCLGGLCGFKGCADDEWCSNLKLPGYGVAQATPNFRCSASHECVAACTTVADCPAVLRLCIPNLACVPDDASGFSFCRMSGDT